MTTDTSVSTMVVALDDSPAALAAAALALDLGRATGATIHAVSVVPTAPTPGPDGDHAARAILRYADHLARAAGRPVVTRCLAGAPAAQVLQYARSVGADLVVIGRSARHGIGEPYVGGQTRHVLEFAECPVLIVPPPAESGHQTAL